MFGFFLKMYMITTTISFVIDYVYLCNFTLSMYKEGYRKLKKMKKLL